MLSLNEMTKGLVKGISTYGCIDNKNEKLLVIELSDGNELEISFFNDKAYLVQNASDSGLCGEICDIDALNSRHTGEGEIDIEEDDDTYDCWGGELTSTRKWEDEDVPF